MAQPLSAPYSYFADQNGAPLAGGKVYTYAAGTADPAATYTDSSSNVPASNPIILDSAGRATIWGSGAYKIVVKDANNVQQYETDGIFLSASTGNMNTSVYDPGNVQEQLVGLTAVQTLSNKTLLGTTTDDDATDGAIGEYVTAVLPKSIPISLSDITAAEVTSISLTAGDWDVWGNIIFIGGSSTVVTLLTGGISKTIGLDGNNLTTGYAQWAGALTGINQNGLSIVPIRISLATTTPIYLVADADFATSTLTAYGSISARRVR